MSFGVIYLLTSPQHTARLVVSIFNLRKFYDGPITLFTTRAESAELIDHLRADRRLNISLATTDEVSAGHNSTYLTKPRLTPGSPYDATLFLDADTLVVGDIGELIEATRRYPLVVTAFCDWYTTDSVIQHRFEKWMPLAGSAEDTFSLNELMAPSLRTAIPAINLGVLGFQRDAPMLRRWRELADFGRDTFLPDEMALQILLPHVPHFLLGTKYNCSPAFLEQPEDVRIWHFAATSHVWHPESRMIWQTAYDECQALNVAGIQNWSRFERKPGPPPPDYVMPMPPKMRIRSKPLSDMGIAKSGAESPGTKETKDT